MTEQIVVWGAGSWGTALAVSLASGGHQVCLWARDPDLVEAMRADRQNKAYLPGVALPPALQLSNDIAEAADGAGLWVIATPSQAVRALCERLQAHAHRKLVVVSVAKGIENGTLMTTTQVVHDVLPEIPTDRIGVLYGPSHAEEVGRGQPTTLVAAASSKAVTYRIQQAFMSPSLRVYANADVLGVEIGGSVKNVLAIAAGICDGVGYGDNAKAALITRGMAEIQRLGLAMGAEATTFSGLTGMGDLVVTCMSQHSRNRYVGEQIGRGRSLEDIEDSMSMVAEGVRTTESVHELAERYQIEMPIVEAVHAILFDGKRPEDAVRDLMARSAKHEDWLPDVLQ